MPGKKELEMPQKTFKDGIKKLQIVFALKELSLDRVTIYWRKLKHINGERFTDVVEKIIERERFFPTIACFRDYLGENNQVQKGASNGQEQV